MPSQLVSFALGVVLTVLVLLATYWAWHPSRPTGVIVPVTSTTYLIPRCDSLAPTGEARAWEGQGMRVNVLQTMPDFHYEVTPLPARAFLAWNKEALLVRVEVDTAQTTEAKNDKRLGDGDSVELAFATGPDFQKSFRVTVAPGFDPQHPAKREVVGEIPQGSHRPFPVTTLSHRTPDGYAVEFSVPWGPFAVTPEAGLAGAIQITARHREGGETTRSVWCAKNEESGRLDQKVPIVLGDKASPPVEALACLTPAGPRTGHVVYSLSFPAQKGHTLTVQCRDRILYRATADGRNAYPEAYFSFPEEWKGHRAEPIVACDNGRVITFLTQDQMIAQLRTLVENLSFHFTPTVFGESQFPHLGMSEEPVVRRLFAPLKVVTTFYNAKFQEVKQADTPGRYGAVVRVTLADGMEITKFVTLYRVPSKFNWWWVKFPLTAQLPAEAGLDPAVLKIQHTEIDETIKTSFIEGMDNNPDNAVLLAALSETSPQDPPYNVRTSAVVRNADWWYELRDRIGLNEDYEYLIDLPAGYEDDPHKAWPLVLYLHGAGERGTNRLKQIRKTGLAGLVANGKQLPAILVSPQCSGRAWEPKLLSRLLGTVAVKYRVDPERIYVTGVSMGGYGTWALALAYPDRFAAIAPICGGGEPAEAAKLKQLPTWAFHGQIDDIVSVNLTTDMVAAIRKAGGHAHQTIYPDVDHNCSPLAYDTEALYTWLFAQRKGQPEVATPGVPNP